MPLAQEDAEEAYHHLTRQKGQGAQSNPRHQDWTAESFIALLEALATLPDGDSVECL